MRGAWLLVVVGLVGCRMHVASTSDGDVRVEEQVAASGGALVEATLRGRTVVLEARPTIGALRAAVHRQAGVALELTAPISWRKDEEDLSPRAWNRAAPGFDARALDLEAGAYSLGFLVDRLTVDFGPLCAPGTLPAEWRPDRVKLLPEPPAELFSSSWLD